MLKNVDLIWGTPVPFDIEKRGLYMIYYGLFIKGVFIGLGFLANKNQMSFKPKQVKSGPLAQAL